MRTRATTGILFMLVMLCCLLSGVYVFTAAFLLIHMFCLHEFYALVNVHPIKPQRRLGLFFSACIFATVSAHYLYKASWDWLLVGLVFVVMILIIELYRKQPYPFHNIAFTFLGVTFVSLPFYLFYALAFVRGAYNLQLPLGFLLLLWANDTGAYLVGRKLGRHPLFERHSPKKTWEGFLGGMVMGFLMLGLLSVICRDFVALPWGVMCLLIVLLGTFGDLTESMLKRSLEAKDSGSLLPGHGGLLDRFDGFLMAAPLVYLYFYVIYNMAL